MIFKTKSSTRKRASSLRLSALLFFTQRLSREKKTFFNFFNKYKMNSSGILKKSKRSYSEPAECSVQIPLWVEQAECHFIGRNRPRNLTLAFDLLRKVNSHSKNIPFAQVH